MFGLRAYIIVAVVVAVGGAKMEVVQQQNEAVMKSLTEEATRLNELNFNLQGKLDAAEEYRNELISKLQKHDLTRLSHQKPGMIEKRINNGTQKVFDSLESLTTTSSK